EDDVVEELVDVLLVDDVVVVLLGEELVVLVTDGMQLPDPSHSPSEHGVPVGSNASTGQVALVPEHTSETSQSPMAGRHVVPPLPATCRHCAVAPSQTALVQTSPSSAHGEPAGSSVQREEQQSPSSRLPSSHSSSPATTPSPQTGVTQAAPARATVRAK